MSPRQHTEVLFWWIRISYYHVWHLVCCAGDAQLCHVPGVLQSTGMLTLLRMYDNLYVCNELMSMHMCVLRIY